MLKSNIRIYTKICKTSLSLKVFESLTSAGSDVKVEYSYLDKDLQDKPARLIIRSDLLYQIRLGFASDSELLRGETMLV